MSKTPHQKQDFTAQKLTAMGINTPNASAIKKFDSPYNKSYNVGNTAATPLHDAKLGRLFYASTEGNNA